MMADDKKNEDAQVEETKVEASEAEAAPAQEAVSEQAAPAPEAAAAFQRGEADFLQAPAQVAEALVAAGEATIVAEMAHEAGPIPYSSYSATRAVLDTQGEALGALIRAHVAASPSLRSINGTEPGRMASTASSSVGTRVPAKRPSFHPPASSLRSSASVRFATSSFLPRQTRRASVVRSNVASWMTTGTPSLVCR